MERLELKLPACGLHDVTDPGFFFERYGTMHDRKRFLSPLRTRRRSAFDVLAIATAFAIVLLVALGALHHNSQKAEAPTPLLVNYTIHR
jgi:hypothetical protein